MNPLHKRRRGRPSRLPAGVVAAILEATQQGLHVKAIARTYGVSATYVRQLARGGRRPAETRPLPNELAKAVEDAPAGAVDARTRGALDMLRDLSADAVRSCLGIGWDPVQIASKLDLPEEYVRSIMISIRRRASALPGAVLGAIYRRYPYEPLARLSLDLRLPQAVVKTVIDAIQTLPLGGGVDSPDDAAVAGEVPGKIRAALVKMAEERG